MAIRIAQASSSENYGKYGVAPNQRRTGVTASNPGGNMDGELNVVKFSGGWECVYRPIDDKVAEFIAAFMESAVKNGSHIGYSQDSTRTGVFDACKKMTLPNPAMINTLVNCDCSSLVGAAIYFAGIKLDSLRKLCTWEMDDVLLNSNAFEKISTKELCQDGKGIRRGDILWRTGHTAAALDSDPAYDKKPMFYFQKFTFSGVSITSGTPGTRAAQKTKSVAKSGYRPVVARLSYVSNSALAEPVPFFGWDDENRLAVNFYRASGSSGKIDVNVMVVYVRNEVTN